MINTPGEGPVSAQRRRVISALGAGALAGLVAGCATPPPPPRPVDRGRAPRIGDTWRYAYRSQWKQVASRMLDVTVVSVTDQEIGDRLTAEGAPTPSVDERFTSQLAIVARTLPGLLVYEFSPYLEAFGPVPAYGRVSVPPPTWGTTWTVNARVVGVEQVMVAAGSFAATRVEILGSRPYIQMDDAADPTWIFATAWFAPAVKRVVRFDYFTQAERLNPLTRDHCELVSYRLG